MIDIKKEEDIFDKAVLKYINGLIKIRDRAIKNDSWFKRLFRSRLDKDYRSDLLDTVISDLTMLASGILAAVTKEKTQMSLDLMKQRSVFDTDTIGLSLSSHVLSRSFINCHIEFITATQRWASAELDYIKQQIIVTSDDIIDTQKQTIGVLNKIAKIN